MNDEEDCNNEISYQSFINALPYSAAILDDEGVIIDVNEKWKEFGRQNNLGMINHGIGINYIRVTEQAAGEDASGSTEAATGIKEIISGQRDIFTLEFPCHSDEEKRWFAMKVKPLNEGALVLHENITERKIEKLWNKALFKNSNSAIARLDSEHKVLNINNKFAEKFGWSLKNIKGKNLDKVLERKNPESIDKNLTKQVMEGQRVKKEGTRYTNKGEAREFLIKGIPVNLEDDVQGIYAIYDDITEIKEKEEILDSIFSSSLDLYYFIAEPTEDNQDAIIKDISPGALQVFGYDNDKISKKDIIGKPISLFQTSKMAEKNPEMHQAVKNGNTITVKNKMIGPDDNEFTVLSFVSPFKTGDNNKVISVSLNISEVEETRKNLAATLDSIGDTVITTDKDGIINRMNPVAEQLTGYSFKEAQNKPLAEIFNIINANTREKVQNPVDEVLKKEKKIGLANHAVLISRNGQEYHIADSAAPIKDAEEDLMGVVLIFRDISEKYKMREKIAESEKRFQKMLEVIPDMISIQDKDMNIIYSNWKEIADVPEHKRQLHTKCYKTYRGYEEICPDCQAISVLENNQPLQKEIKLSNGGWYDLRAIPIQEDSQGNVELFVEWIRDITEIKEREERIRYISYHDSLTDLYNRNYMEEAIKKIDSRDKLPVGVIMVDINGLKVINEAYGHEKGDEILTKTADILTSSIRNKDILARWAGDEFIILLPQTKEKQTKEVINCIKTKVNKTQIEDIPLSFGIGASLKRNRRQNIYEVIHQAEDRVYKDKLTQSRSTKNKLVKSMLSTLGAKSDETKEHSMRMAKYSMQLGEKINLSTDQLNNLTLLATLHDIGKVNIAEEVLNKAEKLTDEEWEKIKEHPEKGYLIASSIEEFAPIAEPILAHHEYWNGDGYPQGLEGEEIPLLARIISIVDAFDVMTNGRPYQKAKTRKEALQEIKDCAGSQFDPKLAAKFVEVIQESDS